MQIEPIIKTIADKKLIGKKLRMSLQNNLTPKLWGEFMPQRKEIQNGLNANLFSMRIYDNITDIGNPSAEFNKCAAVEVSEVDSVPEGMEILVVPAGSYAVFNYKGLSTDGSIFRYIYGTWLPNSDYVLDDRPHFEILGEKYRNNDPNSEEEIWIPVKQK